MSRTFSQACLDPAPRRMVYDRETGYIDPALSQRDQVVGGESVKDPLMELQSLNPSKWALFYDESVAAAIVAVIEAASEIPGRDLDGRFSEEHLLGQPLNHLCSALMGARQIDNPPESE